MCTTSPWGGDTFAVSPASPQIAGQPEVKEVAVGSAAVLPCLASGFPVPEITWSKVRVRGWGCEGRGHPMGADPPYGC